MEERDDDDDRMCISVYLEHNQLDTYISETCIQSHDKQFYCGSCEYASEHKQVVERHIESCHILTDPFSCEFCGSSLKTRFGYKRHVRKHKI